VSGIQEIHLSRQCGGFGCCCGDRRGVWRSHHCPGDQHLYAFDCRDWRQPDFSNLSVTINNSKIMYGAFLNALISFLLIALAVYIFVVAPLNAYSERKRRGQVPPDPTTRKCPECLSEIPIAARRCAFCTAPVDASSVQ